MREVDDLRLACRIGDDGGALCPHGSHHEVFRGTDTCELERDGVADEPLRRRGADVAVFDVKAHAEGLEAEDVHVNLAFADVAAAGHGDDGFAKASDEGPEHSR